MATTSPAGIYYRTNGEAAATSEAQALSLATSVNKAVGLIPVIPTSTTISGGSASVSATGLTTFTNVSNIVLNNAFTSAYANYKTIIEINSASTTLELRTYFASGGSINMTSNYSQAGLQTASNTGTLSTHNGSNIPYAAFGYLQPATNYGRASASQDIYQPATTDFTRYISASQAHTSGGAWTSFFDSGIFSLGTAFDGYTVAASTGTISGTVQVYGYR